MQCRLLPWILVSRTSVASSICTVPEALPRMLLYRAIEVRGKVWLNADVLHKELNSVA
jgi:hypothetical protein